VRQVGYLQRLYRDAARSTEHRKTTNQICTFVLLQQHHPEDGSNRGRNMLVRIWRIKCTIDNKAHFVGCLYITDLINRLTTERVYTLRI